ncbi:MAG: NUDIX domain-containing protein [Lautropia sp.]
MSESPRHDGIGRAPALLSGALAQPVDGFAPQHFRHELIGAVSPQWLALLDPALFETTPRPGSPLPSVRLMGGDRRSESGPMPVATINALLAAWADSLKAKQLLPGWRGEAIHLFGANEAAPLFAIERALLRPLGLLLRSVQVNVFTLDKKRLKVWVARRSASKPVDPGLSDTLVGGGIVGDDSPLETMTREAQEEAGIARALARRAVPVGVIDSTRAVREGPALLLHRERLMLYDLQVPADFAPTPLDGEVAEATLLDADAVLASIARGGWTREGAWASEDLVRRQAAAH